MQNDVAETSFVIPSGESPGPAKVDHQLEASLARRRVTGVVKRRQQVCRPRVVSPEIRHLVRVEVVLSAEDNTLGAAMGRS